MLAKLLGVTVRSEAAVEIGRRVRQARGDVPRDDLAGLAHMDQANLGRIERGEVDPKVSTLIKIAAVLEIDVDTFVSGLTGDMLSERDHHHLLTVREFRDERLRRDPAS